jgi:hypothetical protein
MRKQLLAFAASAALVIGGGGAAALAEAQTAGAAGTTHTLTGITNFSNAVEGAVKVTFTCDDSTGAFTFKAINVQIIEDDHVTQWPYLSVAWSVDGTHFASGSPSLKQDKTNGLFSARSSGTFSDVSACVTGAKFYLEDPPNFGWLNFQATLT